MSSPSTIHNFSDLASSDFALVLKVLELLNEKLPGIDERTMLVGAQARDLIHRRIGASGVHLRSTTDVDIALAVSTHEDYSEITRHFEPRRRASDVKYLIGGLAVDLIPFGDIESPEGIARPLPQSESLSVFAYSSAFENADEYLLPKGVRVKVVDPHHYVALKIDAWVDRSAVYQYKDASDLRAAFDWFRENPEYEELAYTRDPSPAEIYDWDIQLACLWILGLNVGVAVGTNNQQFLLKKWDNQSRENLARHIGGTASSRSSGRSREEVDAFADGLGYRGDM